MFRVIIHVDMRPAPRSYECLEDSRAAARFRAEEVAREGFWIDDIAPVQFVPPARVTLVQVTAGRIHKTDTPRSRAKLPRRDR
jgi:hypothetical protein